ncbi:protein of unknown function [Stenotrophomonas maltophilia]|nr:protein of unknown function [Stenotrophomonas maltophilia]
MKAFVRNQVNKIREGSMLIAVYRCHKRKLPACGKEAKRSCSYCPSSAFRHKKDSVPV